jgi:tRNA-specific 2-thiouridylase
MSGGVDSSVSAALLQAQGYEVIGVTMRMWKNTQDSAIQDAQIVAQKLGIVHHVLDLRAIFKKQIVDYFTSEYLLGRTPNPCVECNRYIKFGELLNWTQSIGVNRLATGHYAAIVLNQDRFLLKKSRSSTKDQTYPLYHLTQKQLAHLQFPLADYEKETVRTIAKKLDLSVADRAESQDICFITDQNYAKFIEEETGLKSQPGNFVDQAGHILGQHRGLYHYTIGQRKGLGVATGQPVFVTKIDLAKNEIVLGEEKDILSKSLLVSQLNFVSVDQIKQNTRVQVKIRYGAQAAEALLIPQTTDVLKVIFDVPQRAATPGQSAVFYQGDYVFWWWNNSGS